MDPYRGLRWGRYSGMVFGPLAAAAPVMMSVASAGMTILGASNQAAGQRTAGQVALNNAILRSEQAKAEAVRQEANAVAVEASGQRRAIEAVRKGDIMASRARAVMAASGAGVDNKLIARLMGEGEYAKDVALFEAGDKARVMRDRGRQAIWSGETGITQGLYEKSSMDARADTTMTMGIISAGMGLAQKYGGDIAGAFGGSGGGDASGVTRAGGGYEASDWDIA